MDIKHKSFKWLALSFFAALVAIGFWFIYFKYDLGSSGKIFGTVKSVNENQIIVFGTFVEGDNYMVKPDYLKRRDMVISITPATKFTKSVWHFPVSADYLAKNRMVPDSNKITKKQEQGSVSDLTQIGGISVTAMVEKNIFNLNSLTALEIIYTVYTYTK